MRQEEQRGCIYFKGKKKKELSIGEQSHKTTKKVAGETKCTRTGVKKELEIKEDKIIYKSHKIHE